MTRIADRYEIIDKLGEGGMGVVFRAHDPAPMDREVAVKTLHEFADPLALELFYKECSALKSISHPNIVEIFDMGEYEEDGHRRPFFVMPLLPGQSLDKLIRSASHRLTVERVVEIFAQTCRGLQAAHDHGIVHRDLKPSNIFVMADDSVKIIDFGVAHAVSIESRTTGFDKGTLLYMAPEQVQHKPVSPQSDIYSLGVTLYEALTRRQPFRAATEQEIIEAILTHIPPSASDLNPAVSHVISRVVHKAMAKQPWHRFDSAREFGDTLQRAARNEAIAIFDPARTQPRIQTATKALEKGDHQFAGEIVAELEAEGNIDPQITLLRTQIDQITRQKTIAQLLESARARFEEEEDPLALSKLQELLQLDPTNVAALGLKSKIEDRRSERQIEKWIQLARQHMDNHSYGHAREALQNTLVLRPNDSRAARLLREIEADEQEYVRLRREKTAMYEAAVNAWKNGEISQALSQMRQVLDLDRRAPDASSPGATGAYQSFYDKVRSEHETLNNGYAEARRHLADKRFAQALQICADFLAKYPGQALFQALKFDIEEQQRQQLSAFIADVDRRLETEPDLDARLALLRDAVAEYPDEDHFKRLATVLEDKRTLVNSIVERAKVHEGNGQFTEALADLDTLQTIYSLYPGLSFERERLDKRLQQQARDAARAAWVRQIDAQLSAGEYVPAAALLDKAEADFPEDAELAELRKLARQGSERTSRADQLLIEGQALCAQGQFDKGVELLNTALQFDDRTSIRMALRDLFVTRAQEGLASDWRVTETFAARALELDPNHALARSLRAQALDKKRGEEVEQCASQSRRLQAAGEIDAAMAEVERGLGMYPGDARLSLIADALRKELGRPIPPPIEHATQPTASTRPTAPSSSRSAPAAAAPSAPAAAIERTRLVTDRRAGHSAQPLALEETVVIDRAPAVPPQPPATPAAVGPPVPAAPKRAGVSRQAAIAAAVIVAIIIAVVVIQRYRVAAPPVQPQATIDAPPKTSTAPTAAAAPAQSEPAIPAVQEPAPAPASATPPGVGDLTLKGVRPGTRVLLDNASIGVVGGDGSLSHPGIAPGRHTLQFSLRGYDTFTVTRDFVAGETVAFTGADVKLIPSPSIVDLQADSGTAITIAQAGKTIQQLNGASKIPLAEGTYDVVAKGPPGVATSTRISVPAGGALTIDVRSLIVSGMERFDRAGWTQTDSWFTRRGGNFVLYNRTGGQGTISFTIRTDRAGNPFSTGARLSWLVGYADSRNYVLLQLDKDFFYRTVIINSVPQPATKAQHGIPGDAPYVNLRVQLSSARLVHEYSIQPNVWHALDAWSPAGVPSTGKRSIIDGQFGFFLPGTEEIAISNFLYYPPITPTPISPPR